MEPPSFSPRPHRVEALFTAALDRPRDERTAFLRHACGDDLILYREVESLLAAFDEAGDFLHELDSKQAAVLVEQAGGSPEEMVQSIGPYCLVEEIGRGGMGVVYLAERDDGQFQQRVALKLVKRGMDTDAILRRFLHERQILASLNHVGIARLLDGGVTDEGRPYFAMEHIEGEPILGYCDRRQLPVDARLRLFKRVGRAVQHAHRHLVIHRDLKPSNILVTEDETGEPQVKLLDFGIAKLLSEEGEGLTRQTKAGERVLTPEYAAPEQMLGEPVTTATDVYSLGVLLYELLTGHLPYQFERQTPEAMAHVVAGTEPVEPSTAAARIEEVHHSDGTTETITPETVSRARSTEPERLQRRLSGDLDAIVLTALRKEPERRYASAEAFIEDIKRHLDGLPVQARRDTLGYRLGKFARRHRGGVAAALLVVLSLVGGLGAALWQARQKAQEAAKAEEVKDFVLSLFEMSDPSEAKGETVTARELLEEGTARIEKELLGQPMVQAEMMNVIGVVYMNLGLYDDARGLLERALATRKDLLREHLDVAESLQDLATLRLYEGQFGAADSLYREALSMRRRLLGEEHPDVAESLFSLALVLGDKGDYAEAESLAREALAMQRMLLGEEHEDFAFTLNYIGGMASRRGDHAEAAAIWRDVLALMRKLHGEEHPYVAATLGNLSMALLKQNDYAAAESLAREAVVLQSKLLGEKHPALAIAINNLAEVLRKRGAYDEAEALYREALTLWRTQLGQEHPNITYAMNNLALVLKQKGDYEAAEPLYRKTLALRRKVMGEEHPQVAGSLYNLAALLQDKGDYEAAEPLYREALAMQRKLLGKEHPRVASTLHRLAATRVEQGAYDAADSLYREALAMRRKLFGETHPNTASTLSGLGHSLLDQDRAAEAESMLREAEQSWTEAFEEDDRRLLDVRQTLGACLLALGRFEEAEDMLLRIYPILQQKYGATNHRTTETRETLIELYSAWGKPHQAATYQETLPSLSSERR